MKAGSGSPGGLSFSLFVPARFGALDERAKFHQVMRCCPSCGAPLVLFRDKFGEVAGRGAPGLPRAPPHGGPTGAGAEGAITGGWVCTKCGVHIVPNDKTQTPVSTEPKHPGGGHGPGLDKNQQKGSRTPGSREVSPQRPPGIPHQVVPASPNNLADKSTTSPQSPKPPVIIDDDYEIWERQVKNSFTSFLTQIRERLGHKEISLKQYQVTLCQRERQLRANEEGMVQRWTKFRQSEQNFKTKMDRLNLYKDTMIHQLEAKARQLTQYEQRLRTNNDLHTSSHDIRGSTSDIKSSMLEFNINSPPEDVKNMSCNNVRNMSMDEGRNTSVNVTRNTSIDGSKNTSKDLWNTSGNSDAINNTFNNAPQNENPRNPKTKPTVCDNRVSGQSSAENRPKVAVTMVKPTLEFRRPQTSGSVDLRGSQTALARDFRPNGATSANINQIYTRSDSMTGYNWDKQQPVAQSHPRPPTAVPAHHPDNASYLHRKTQLPQKPLSPSASRNGSSYDVRQAYFTRKPQEQHAIHKPAIPANPAIRPQGAENRHVAGNVRHPGDDVRHAVSEIRHSGGDVRHADGTIRHAGGDIRRSGGEARLSGGEARLSGGEARLPGVDVRHAVSDVRNLGSDVRHSGDNVRPSVGDVRSLRSELKHVSPDGRSPGSSSVRTSGAEVARQTSHDGSRGQSAPVRTAIPPQQKPPLMPLKSALKSPDTSSSAPRWITQTNLHVSNIEAADTTSNRGKIVKSYTEHDSESLSPSERERSVSGLSDLSPTYTTSGYASDRDTSLNGGSGSGKRGEKEKHNVSFEDMISGSSPQDSVERDTRPSWMKRRSRRLTEV